MRKLKLESLTVESFETTPVAPRERGTVDAHAKPRPTTVQTYDVQVCGITLYFDCSYGCSQNTACPEECYVELVTVEDCA